MPGPRTAEQRISELEQQVKILLASHFTNEVRLAERNAKDIARWEALVAVAVEAGLDKKHFISQLEEKERYYHDLFLRQVEKNDPAFAALMDVRTPDEISTMTDAEAFSGKPLDIPPPPPL